MSRRLRWVFAVAAILIAIHLALMIDMHWEQDRCTFGPVSNERYRELLAEAKHRQATTGPRLVREDYQAGVLLNERFDDLSRGITSLYERIAAMHAVVRALGADYRGPTTRRQDSYERAAARSSFVGFDYHLDINRLGMFAPFRRRAVVFANVSAGHKITHNSSARFEKGAVSYIVLFPKLLEKFHWIPRSDFGEVCPPVPTPEQVESFSPQVTR